MLCASKSNSASASMPEVSNSFFLLLLKNFFINARQSRLINSGPPIALNKSKIHHRPLLLVFFTLSIVFCVSCSVV